MPGPRFARFLACLVAPVSATVAFAQPPERVRHTTVSAAVSKPPTALASAYLAGKQALVGLHAPSNDPVSIDSTGRPMLALKTINRGEALAIPATADDGGFASIDLDRAAHLLRAAGGEEHPVDPRTVTLLYRIQRHFDVPELRVVSGYRVPRLGSHSNHSKGRAVDLIVPGTCDADVASFVRALGFVGVGVYPSSQFVHVDVRPRSYFWVDFSGPHMKNRERGILGDLAVKSDTTALANGGLRIEPFAIGSDVDAAVGPFDRNATTASPEDDEDEEN
jgi:uncharacterized protein YcbK (DUF882 family)